jgi:16S rRNA processing protein RimM
VVARVTGAYGIKGWIKLSPESSPSNSVLLHTRSWWLQANGKPPTPIVVQQVRAQGHSIVAQFAGVALREQAEGLRSQLVLVCRSEFPAPPEGEYYWVDLIGCVVENATGIVLGTVAELVDHGAHSILVVTPGHALAATAASATATARLEATTTTATAKAKAPELVLIPFVARYLLGVDLTGRKIRVDWELDS